MKIGPLLEGFMDGSRAAMLYTVAGLIGLGLYSLIIEAEKVHLSVSIAVTAMISVLLGGVKAGKRALTSGWLHGALVAGLYLFVLAAIKMFLFPASGYSFLDLIFAVILIGTGCIGGITGINIRFNQRRKSRNFSV